MFKINALSLFLVVYGKLSTQFLMNLQCLFEDESGVGITAVKIIGNRVVAAKLTGSIDFLELESYSHGRQMDWGFTAYRRSRYSFANHSILSFS